jgi:hypothetical protein
MSWLASIFLALFTGALGVICGWIVGSACVNWYHISGFEGGSGYFVVAIAFWGGVLALLQERSLLELWARPQFLHSLRR